MLRERSGLVIGILLVVILILAGLLFYTYVAKPYISGYQNKIYNQGASDALTVLINQVQARGYAEIPVNNGQLLVLVPVQPQNPAAVQTGETLQ